MKSQIVAVDQEQIFKLSEECFCRICDYRESQNGKNDAFLLRERYKEQLVPRILIKNSHDNRIYYAMCVNPMTGTENLDLLDEFYLDCWMTAVLDAAREWLRKYLTEQERRIGSSLMISGPWGPGFYGIGLEELEEYLALSDGGQIGIDIRKGMLHPVKSNVGYYLRTKESEPWGPDCAHCLSDRKNCPHCMNYNRK